MERLGVRVLDIDAGGDIHRIVVDGVKEIPGKSVREKMLYLRDHCDGFRKTLLSEPYGIPEMSVDLITSPTLQNALYGYIIMEVMGYPIYSGSNTMATAAGIIEAKDIKKQEGRNCFEIESPAGIVAIDAWIKDGKLESITCEGLPSYIEKFHETIEVKGLGDVNYSIAYSGGFYVLLDAKDFGLSLVKSEEARLKEIAFLVTEEINKKQKFSHYSLGDVGPIPFVHFMGELKKEKKYSFRSLSATYVHPGVICWSTTGTGTSARLAYHYYKNELGVGDSLTTLSLRDTYFRGTIEKVQKENGKDVIKNQTTGSTYILNDSWIYFYKGHRQTPFQEIEKIAKRST